MPLSKLIALAAPSLAALLFSSGQVLAGVNFVAPGVGGSVTNLAVGGNVYDVTFVGNVTHADWVNQLDSRSSSDPCAFSRSVPPGVLGCFLYSTSIDKQAMVVVRQD